MFNWIHDKTYKSWNQLEFTATLLAKRAFIAGPRVWPLRTYVYVHCTPTSACKGTLYHWPHSSPKTMYTNTVCCSRHSLGLVVTFSGLMSDAHFLKNINACSSINFNTKFFVVIESRLFFYLVSPLCGYVRMFSRK